MSSRSHRLLALAKKKADQQIVQEAASREDLRSSAAFSGHHSPTVASPENLSPPATSTENLSLAAASPEYLNPPAASPENPRPSTSGLQGRFEHLSSSESDPFEDSEESYRPSDEQDVMKNAISDDNSSDDYSSDNSSSSDTDLKATVNPPK
ncbi:unnamed protein product [Acanthoscelides obtectus]|uniref:Uncharacterized protein n=1 Tax=Acanthoscelides obtectus TaxID=200917 RepID=A0A9P0L8L2_ACAOB|nr:unnamed protein product [Acanthoscelides obtectus]CAK1680645.1 hypothetical protein AOBTE_LOCUS32821 [Acanthoscelides obtectus]